MPSNLRLLMVWLFAVGTLLSAQTPSGSRAKQKAAPPAPAKEQVYKLRGRVLASGVEQPVDSALITFKSTGKDIDDVFTNTKGEFEIELPAGDYKYEIKIYGYELDGGARNDLTITAGKTLEPLIIHLLRGAEVSGLLEDAEGHPLAGVPIEVLGTTSTLRPQNATTGADGKFSIASVMPGSYLIRALMTALEPGASFAFVTTYYPGTTDSFAAGDVILNGADVPNIRFRMQRSALHSVSGVVTGHQGNSLAAVAALRPIEDSRTVGSLLSQIALRRDSNIAEDGSFAFNDVPPGPYTVVVEGSRATFPLASTGQFTVSDRDIENLRMAIATTGDFAGKIVSENGKLPKDWGYSSLMGQTAAGRVGSQLKIKKDGSFSFNDMPSGSYMFSLTAETGYTVSSVEIGGRKFEGSKFSFDGPGGTDAVITVSPGGALIQGSLAAPHDPKQPVVGTATAVMLSGLTDGLRYLRRATMSSDGSFTLIDLEAGRYLVCGWSDYSTRVDRLLNSDRPPVERLQELCKTVDVKKDGSESVAVRLTSLTKVMR